MEIIFYIFLLLICEIFVYALIIGADYYVKSINCKQIKCPKIIVKSKYDKSNQVSKMVYCFQVFNYVYICLYLLIAIIDSFIYKNSILFNINFYSLTIYSILVIICLVIVSIFSPKKQKDGNPSLFC